MSEPLAHRWDLTPKEAIALQREMRDAVIARDDFGEIKRVAGVDCGFEQNGKITRAAVAVLELPSLNLVEHALARAPTTFPYVPGLLSFREVPAILEALKQLDAQPDLLLVDGQGMAHPRRFGIACHLGVLTGLTAIGVGKTRLMGRYDEPALERAKWTHLTDGAEVIGAVLRTRADTKPVFVSVGHRIGLASAVEWVMRCTTRFRLPETTRQAHRLASG